MTKRKQSLAGSNTLLAKVRSAALSLFLSLLLATVPASAATVVAWGENTYGQASVPANVTNVATIAAGGYFNLALRSNGTVIAWGQNTSGQTNVPATATNVMVISGGYSHALVLRSNGTMVAWGDNFYGQTNLPPGLPGIKAIAACMFHSLAVTTNGTVIAWGYNTNGQTIVPAAATNIASVAGGYGCFALRSNGTVVAWGSTYVNQTNVLPTLTNISAIASGLGHALALRSNGTVIAWGDNSFGQTNVPFGLANVATIGCGANHSFAIESNGFMYVWGRDTFGQVSGGPPQPINGVTPAIGGYYHSLAMGYFNDNFADRMPLTGTNILIKANNQNATTETGIGEPFHHPTVFTGHTVWFTWTAPASGGAILTATNTDGSVDAPILAVYSGSSLTTLTQLTVNAANSASYNIARAVFTAVAGQTYQIAFAGGSDLGGGQGNAYVRLNLSPSPANDLFANAAVITDNYYTLTSSFVGASREPSEPSHSDATLGQTLWWNWTAPTNGPSPLSVRLMADAVSFPPAMGVYTGNAVASLATVTLTKKTNGMSSEATFNATPGTTYRLALAGKQTDPDSTAPVFGSFRFRLNCRAFGLTITNLTSTTNGAGAVTFNANALLQNFTASPSGPLRISVSAISGQSTTEPVASLPTSTVTNLGNFPATSTNLNAGQSVLIPISGIVPAPTTDPANPIAYGAYASLQTQPVTNQWFTVDETLITFDKWPGVGQVFGPGGGVIRLDPGYVGTSAFNPLASVNAVGSATVIEGSPASYYGQARYANNLLINFTNTTWFATRFTITNGLFSPGSVTSNTAVMLTAKYSASGFIYDAPTNVTVINLPAPTLAQPKVIGGNFTLQVQGVSNRIHVVEATTNLAPTQIWLPVGTNTIGASGLWNFTNATGVIPQKFFRAREAE